ncbi:unnamed protein product [marine sediment metagenome]|uniref:Uncharacterized protein n=1 Tax=marine sediment metagenome TaxID=412755 RepID=X0TQP6_9ZZZZ
MKGHKNPRVKRGDLIILKKGNNGNEHWVGKIAKVVQTYDGYFQVSCVDGSLIGLINVYATQPGDIYVLADREHELEFLRKKVKTAEREFKTMKTRIEVLELYKDDADYLAHKLEKVFKGHKDNPIPAMRKVLKEFVPN